MNTWPVSLYLLPLLASATLAAAPAVYRINCGGDKFADDSGHVWQADAHFTGGKGHSEWNDTYGTQNKHLHLSWRYQDTIPMVYAFSAPAGNYKLRLHFSEHDTAVLGAGDRVFRIRANGAVLIDSLDLYAEAFGGAVTKEFIVASQKDSIRVTFENIRSLAVVSGIEVYPETWQDEPFPSTPPYRLACGGLGFTDGHGNIWLPDGAYGEGGRDSHFKGVIAKADAPELYLSERWDNSFSYGMTYAFPIPDDRNYVVRLHFAETNASTSKIGGRVFGILINDTMALDFVDIFAAVGAFAPYVLEFNAVRGSDGMIHVGFGSHVDAAKINGVEVFQGTAKVAPRKWACIGNSITQGSNGPSYVPKLAALLGPGYVLENDGVSGTTLLKKGDNPYWKNGKLANVFALQPDIISIKLGTNDSKAWNWKFGNEFEADLIALIDTLASIPSHPKIWLVLPCPAFANPFAIDDAVISGGILPIYRKVAAAKGLDLIDANTPLQGHPEYFADGVHPNSAGADAIAGEFYRAFTDKARTGIVRRERGRDPEPEREIFSRFPRAGNRDVKGRRW